MLCEHANPQLIEYAEGTLEPQTQTDVERHLSTCGTCQADYTAITQWRTMAGNWHDEIVPSWQPARIPRRDLFDSLRLWFPMAASTVALAMATMIFVQTPQTAGTLPNNRQSTANFETLPPLPQAQQAAMVERVMQGSREQRQEELQVLLKILKSEMDRRAMETEESLRYVISHQLQGQEELDELYQQVEAMMGQAPRTAAGTPSNPGDVSP